MVEVETELVEKEELFQEHESLLVEVASSKYLRLG